MRKKLLSISFIVLILLTSCSKNSIDENYYNLSSSLYQRNSISIGELHNELVQRIMPTFENQYPNFLIVNERIIDTGLTMDIIFPINLNNNNLLDSLFYKSNLNEDSINKVHFFRILDKALDSLVNYKIINSGLKNYFRNSINAIYTNRDYDFETMKVEASNLCRNDFERFFIMSCYSIGQNSYDLWNVPENEIEAIGHIVAADLVGGVLGGLFGAAESAIRKKDYTYEDAAWHILGGAVSSSVGGGLFKLAKYVMK